MTEDLITDLSKVAGLLVIARNSTFAYKGKPKDIREMAKTLGVRYVLEGSVRRSGGEVRVNAQLIDATTGGHVWADRYDGDMKNVFGLQDKVTRNVVTALAVKLTKEDRERVARRSTREHPSIRRLPERLAALPPADARGFPHRDRRFQEGRGTGSEVRSGVRSLAATYWEAYDAILGSGVGIQRASQETSLPSRTVPGEGHARPDAARASSRQRYAACTHSSTTKRSPKRSERSQAIRTMRMATLPWRTR